MPIPKNDYEVVMDVPQWLLKKMVKVEPSPIVGGDGEGVYYIGKFSDTWAPEDLRNKEFYYVHAKAVLSPEVSSKFEDPLFAGFATSLCYIFFVNHCGPKGTTTWSACLDPQFETGGSCYGSSTISGTDFSQCMYSSAYAPAMFIFNSASTFDTTTLVAYSKPCPTASSAPSLSGKSEMSGRTLIRAVGCDDSSNKVRYLRYTSEDRSTASYTIASVGLGAIVDASTIYRHATYPLSSSVTKSATDYYYYIYTIGFQYQYT
jgi:hypothetical protein